MQGVNSYWKQLSPEEISASKHREFVGGLWEELGKLQFEFMRSQGLRPEHRLLDVGCGALRGGLFFVDYLAPGNYFGLDINESLIEAGRMELRQAGLHDKQPSLMVNSEFNASLFRTKFDFALAMSVFTHLFSNHIIRCLLEVGKILEPTGSFFATFFEAPFPGHLQSLNHQPGGVVTNFDSDPFHYSLEEMKGLAAHAGMQVRYLGDWQHPRDQKMLCFTSSRRDREERDRRA